MPKSVDGSFLTGSILVLLAVGIAYAARTNPSLPVIGSGRGALLAIAVIGMAACSVGGLSQASVLGWTNPVMVIGTVFGIAAIAITAAGLLGWESLLRPIVQLVPGNLASGVAAEGLAIVALTGLIVLKWIIGVGMALTRTTTAG